ncbi:hypothetical protein OHS59_05585 [Streptomyces sp. NBC_00414]|uniref:hypothetical protein n=1 Tax=Streptomyces sp. NBC_00414 TaxID=2975739 RepID=UPI002E1DBB63
MVAPRASVYVIDLRAVSFIYSTGGTESTGPHLPDLAGRRARRRARAVSAHGTPCASSPGFLTDESERASSAPATSFAGVDHRTVPSPCAPADG